MTVQEELRDVLAEVKARRWTPELFDRVRTLLDYSSVFNVIRKYLPPEEYKQFDIEYCEHIHPGQSELIQWLRKEREKAFWIQKKREAEQRRLELLGKKKRILNGLKQSSKQQTRKQ